MEFFRESERSFSVKLNGDPLLVHSDVDPLFSIGSCRSSYQMHLGHFLIDQSVAKRRPLLVHRIEPIDDDQSYQITFLNEDQSEELQVKFTVTSDRFVVEFPLSETSKYVRSILEEEEIIPRNRSSLDDSDRRHLWFALKALPFAEETLQGCGAQFHRRDLRGDIFPIWVSEWFHRELHSEEDEEKKRWSSSLVNTTYHPQPRFSSSRGYHFTLFTSAYSQFDFRAEDSHRFHLAALPYRIELTLSPPSAVSPLNQTIPQWISNGLILGIQGGTEVVDQKLALMSSAGTRLAGIWIQDWCGKRVTSFGKRVFWNWKWNEQFYPHLREKINEWKEKYDDCRVLVYLNPYLASDGSIFAEAKEKDFLVQTLREENEVYLVDFGQFQGGIVDLTNPQAFQWYKQVIRTHLIDLGVSGWMADFGEYLPTDVRLFANISGELLHNLWPILWAKCNYEAIRDAQKLDEVIFFMRSGFLNIQRYSSFFWLGDQSANFSSHSGLPAGIRSTLSLACSSSIPFLHMDIGGYFTRADQGRSKEVLLRWCEISTFNLLMRTHEGNRPQLNAQFDSDPPTREFFARMSRIHRHLKPYFRHSIDQAFRLQRSTITPQGEREYLIGEDLFISPVLTEKSEEWRVNIPQGEWVHLWTDEVFQQGEHLVGAPLGQPPVFFRLQSDWTTLFQQVKRID